MKVELLKARVVKRKQAKIGDVVDIPDNQAKHLIKNGLAAAPKVAKAPTKTK